ncbi:MAG: class I SAM-dependent methyltransferase, partial [Pseudomonadales bacterium]
MKSIDFDIEIRKRFDHEKVAENYLRRKHVRDTPKNRRELACIRRAIASIPEGVTVLDLPTGTGRLIPMLLEHGVRVIAADYSEHMLSAAESYFKTGEHALSRDLL